MTNGRAARSESSLRILHVPHAYHPVVGGAELICKKVSELLCARGHRVTVLTTDAGAVQTYYEFGVPSVRGAESIVHGVSVRRLIFSGTLYRVGGWANSSACLTWLGRRIGSRVHHYLRRRLDRQISAEIARTCPDIVMTMPHLVVNVQSVLAARSRLKFPLVMVPMLHEHDKNKNISATAEKLAAADAIIALTRYEAARLTEDYCVAPDKVFMASVGIDMPPIRRQTERANRIAYLGRQVKSKGISDLLEAMRLVWPVYPKTELYIAGVRVPESAEIDDMISTLPERWRDRVRNLGDISESEKNDLLRSSRCLVLPSKTESFGLVILDAWAQETPTVTYDLPVFRSIIDHGINGLLADPRRGPRALADSITALLDAPQEAERMGLAGYREAARNYSWNSVAAVYLDAYKYAIDRSRRGER